MNTGEYEHPSVLGKGDQKKFIDTNSQSWNLENQKGIIITQ